MASQDLVAQLAKKPPAVKLGILVGVMAVLGLLYWQLVYSSLQEDMAKSARTRDTLDKEHKKLEADLARRSELVESSGAPFDTAVALQPRARPPGWTWRRPSSLCVGCRRQVSTLCARRTRRRSRASVLCADR